jgi:hypothetical protein
MRIPRISTHSKGAVPIRVNSRNSRLNAFSGPQVCVQKVHQYHGFVRACAVSQSSKFSREISTACAVSASAVRLAAT